MPTPRKPCRSWKRCCNYSALSSFGHKGCRDDAGLTADELDGLRGVCQNAGVCTHAITDAQSHGNDGQGARGHLLFGDELDTRHHDGREHHDSRTAQNSLRHNGDQCAQLGDEAAEDQEDCTGSQCTTVDHLGHGHQTDILAERGVGQHAKAGGKGGAQAVADDTA